MGFPTGFVPVWAELWSKCVAVKIGIDFGDNSRVCIGQRLCIDLRTADDPNVGKMLTKR